MRLVFALFALFFAVPANASTVVNIDGQDWRIENVYAWVIEWDPEAVRADFLDFQPWWNDEALALQFAGAAMLENVLFAWAEAPTDDFLLTAKSCMTCEGGAQLSAVSMGISSNFAKATPVPLPASALLLLSSICVFQCALARRRRPDSA